MTSNEPFKPKTRTGEAKYRQEAVALRNNVGEHSGKFAGRLP